MSTYLFTPPPIVSAPIDGESLRYPIRRIFCVGRNYEAHAREMGMAVDREAPFYFTKAACHYVASGSTIAYPPVTKNYHHEMELVVAIGGNGFELTRERALDIVYGYACGLDMTRRDLQFAARDKSRPWDTGKDFEDAAVLAPIVPAARCGHLTKGRIEFAVNGTTKQNSDLALLIHDVAAVIVDLSRLYHLAPGDLIYTGTPEGVGPVQPGDRLEGRIEGLGGIRLTIAGRA